MIEATKLRETKLLTVRWLDTNSVWLVLSDWGCSVYSVIVTYTHSNHSRYVTSTNVAQRLQTHFNRQDMATLESQWITSRSSTRSNDWAMRCVAVNCHYNNEFKVSYMGLRQIVSEMEFSQTKTSTESVWIVPDWCTKGPSTSSLISCRPIKVFSGVNKSAPYPCPLVSNDSW